MGVQQACTAEPDQASSDRLERLLGVPPDIDLGRLREELLRAPDILGARLGRAARIAPYRRNVRVAHPCMHALQPHSAQPLQQRVAVIAPAQGVARDTGSLAQSREGTAVPASVGCGAAAAVSVDRVHKIGAIAWQTAEEAKFDSLERMSEIRHVRATQPHGAQSGCGYDGQSQSLAKICNLLEHLVGLRLGD